MWLNHAKSTSKRVGTHQTSKFFLVKNGFHVCVWHTHTMVSMVGFQITICETVTKYHLLVNHQKLVDVRVFAGEIEFFTG